MTTSAQPTTGGDVLRHTDGFDKREKKQTVTVFKHAFDINIKKEITPI